jgi:t-SNARE complex subunit (syntaxin)
MLATASSEDAQAIALKDQLDERATSTRALFASLKNRLHVLEQGNANLRALIPLGQSLYNLTIADVQVRDQQVGALKERFKDAIQRYAEVERDNRNKHRARLEKQVKVVNPGMTAFEVSEVVKAAEAGGDNAMFSQAVRFLSLPFLLYSNAADSLLTVTFRRNSSLRMDTALRPLEERFVKLRTAPLNSQGLSRPSSSSLNSSPTFVPSSPLFLR